MSNLTGFSILSAQQFVAVTWKLAKEAQLSCHHKGPCTVGTLVLATQGPDRIEASF